MVQNIFKTQKYNLNCAIQLKVDKLSEADT